MRSHITNDIDDVVVAEWRYSKRDVLRVLIVRFQGRRYVDVRNWYRDAEGTLCRGRGICVREGDIKALRRAIRKAERKLRLQP